MFPSTDDAMRLKSTIKPAVYFRYILLESIELAAVILALVVVRQWWALSDWLFGSLVIGWILKDVVLFPFVWRAYDQDAPGETGDMIGELGIAKGLLNPSGYIQVRGELWKAVRAENGPPIEKECLVRIRHREGLTLYVMPVDQEQHRSDRI